ncbi:hypothetical protein SAY87_002424 [Trapa incisa]|uniref:Uncharacterized protein n=1 Tax=Trapa incisa TaxID=236973 RepID=A0AAN7JT37_9MYRT|nr:hypothetical protein SAY87_002424 [Trapa incisa]
MDINIPSSTKKIWNILKAVLFMMRKGVSKRKLMLDLNMMLKRGKIAGKAIVGNLMMFHHHHNHHYPSRLGSAATSSSTPCPIGPFEYEFSCSNSPVDPHGRLNSSHGNFFSPFHLRKHRKAAGGGGGGLNSFFSCIDLPPTLEDNPAGPFQLELAVLEFLNTYQPDPATPSLVAASPILPGFGRTPLVRQLRITDSPFPLKSEEDEDDYVDKAAEEFIERFYKELKRQ